MCGYVVLPRLAADCIRLYDECDKRCSISGELHQEGLQAAEAVIMKHVQWKMFPDEISIFTKNKYSCGRKWWANDFEKQFVVSVRIYAG